MEGCEAGQAIAADLCRGKSGLHRAGWWITSTVRKGRDSATESKPPRSVVRLRPRRSAAVRVKRCGKSAPAGRATGLARQTSPGARPSREKRVAVPPQRHGSARSVILPGRSHRGGEQSPSQRNDRPRHNPAYRPASHFLTDVILRRGCRAVRPKEQQRRDCGRSLGPGWCPTRHRDSADRRVERLPRRPRAA